MFDPHSDGPGVRPCPGLPPTRAHSPVARAVAARGRFSRRVGHPCSWLSEQAARVVSAVWRRKYGLIIDPRLLSLNATCDPAGLKRKGRRADFLRWALSSYAAWLPLSSRAAAICHKEQVFAILCSVYSFGEASHKSCPAINDKNHWYA